MRRTKRTKWGIAGRKFGEPAELMDREMERERDAWDRENAKSFAIVVPGSIAHALAALAKRERRSLEDQILIMLRDSLPEHGINSFDYGRPRDVNAPPDAPLSESNRSSPKRPRRARR